jgi:hypothetical protein
MQGSRVKRRRQVVIKLEEICWGCIVCFASKYSLLGLLAAHGPNGDELSRCCEASTVTP